MAMYGTGLVSPVQCLGFNGHARAWVDLRDAESRAAYLSESFWPEIHPIVAAFIGRGGHLFDIGANFGLVTFGTVPLVQGRGVGFHLFEANARIVPLLRKSAELWGRESFVINHCCVTDRQGMSRFSLTDESWGHGQIGEHSEVVPNLMLDDYISGRGIERISFMKMDIEGWEPFALNGARRALTSGKVEAAFIEVAPALLQRTRTSAEELLGALVKFGFDPYFVELYEHQNVHGLRWVPVAVNGTTLRFARARPLPTTYVQGDVLAIYRETPIGASLGKAVH